MHLAAGSLLVISPHLDDAIFSCGRLLIARPGSRVVTLFTGTPRHPDVSTDWDRHCGFCDAAEAMQVRRQEDAAAMRIVGAESEWLDFLDGQYDEPATPERIGEALAAVLLRQRPSELLLPLGLFHPDHLLAHAAAAEAIVIARRQAWRPERVLAYEDAPYRGMEGMLQARLAALAAAGIRATPVDVDADGDAAGDLATKRLAVAAYFSQVPMFEMDGLDDLWREERFWQLDGTPFTEAESPA